MEINRRHFIRALGAAALAGGALPAGNARAAGSCGGWFPYGAGLAPNCFVGVRVPGISAQQRCDQWCWAACIEAAFSIQGHDLPQEAIVEKLYGSSFVCELAIGPGIVSAVNGRWTDDRGRRFRARAHVLTDLQFGVADPFALQRAIGFLADDVPLINGAVGHATLVTRMDWAEDSFGNSQLTNITVRDPWPGNPNRRSLTGQEVYGTNFLAAVTVS
jgi:hypothetical protein